MRNSLKALLCLSALSGMLCMAAPASADPIVDGQTLNTSTIGTFNNALFVAAPGGLINGTFATPGGDTGTYTARAGFYNGSSNISFLYQFQVSSGFIDQFASSSFNGFTTNVLAATTGPLGTGSAPSSTDTVVRTSGVIDVNFDITAGMTSYAVLISTNATQFSPGLLSVQDGGSENIAGFQPTPEFGSSTLMGLMLVGFGGIFGVRRFRMPAVA